MFFQVQSLVKPLSPRARKQRASKDAEPFMVRKETKSKQGCRTLHSEEENLNLIQINVYVCTCVCTCKCTCVHSHTHLNFLNSGIPPIFVLYCIVLYWALDIVHYRIPMYY